ncbi:LRR domain containing protein [Parasponia andersonii]|uniref:LRR domain containing protein n=1 Tax=Parasponia andersonii TaxID=3476 RepID=A0A2P5DEE1_PARAD|nr:LRR domain containing protein [Parasponia andersonii]
MCLFDISDTATEKLPLLEELELTLDNFSSSCFIDLQNRCPHLRTLKVNRQDYNTDVQPPDHEVTEASYKDVALTIAHFLPELRHLQLIGNPMTNMGLEAMLDLRRSMSKI